ncbi:COR domain-containing protein [Marinomonas fungiae]|uniref:COR domain-containing protein n=1 Tax=Marinomonas fungiae TaxID=1137284 RepID=UPI003A914F94
MSEDFSEEELSPEEAYQEALKRINHWQPGEMLDLSIPRLGKIPEEIQQLTELEHFIICGSPGRKLAISDLSSLSSLARLNSINCACSEVVDLRPLANLMQLQELFCFGTKVSDLSPLANLVQLQELFCFATKVSDLSPLANLVQLQKLDCSFSEVSDLSPLLKLTQLQSLRCMKNQLREVSSGLWFLPNLKEVFLYKSAFPNIPAEVLSSGIFDNCLESLRAHYRDLSDTPEPLREAKLMLLGNGRVGKTQLGRYLKGLPFEPESDSTHGILLTSAPVPSEQEREKEGETDADNKDQFQIWDFGGQDIYHGTHSLFLRNRAAFVIAWSPEMESLASHTHNGMHFRNYPLLYWLALVKQFAGKDALVLVVQTHCDQLGQEQTLPDEVNKVLAEFRYAQILKFSALNGRGGAALKEALREVYEVLDKPLVGLGRQVIKRELEQQREQGLLRWLTFEEFTTRCRQQQTISSEAHFADFLHQIGTVFYQETLFERRLILDQAWMLEAIYALFHRDHCYQLLLRLKGRFKAQDLADWLWNEQGHSPEDQAHFIDMMVSSAVCFPITPESWRRDKSEIEYLMPECLPEQPPEDLPDKWHTEQTIQSACYTYTVLPSLLLRTFMARVGTKAGLWGDYWRSGFFISERTTGSRALIELNRQEGWQGEIVIKTQGKKDQVLLQKLGELLERTGRNLGMEPVSNIQNFTDVIAPFPGLYVDNEASLSFVPKRPTQPQWYVSYAWKNEHSATEQRLEEKVDELCEKARQQNIPLIRDKDVLRHGDSIQRYMDQLAQGDRIVVFLSHKYLTSYYCMYELQQIWRLVQQDADLLVDKVRLYLLDDANIDTIPKRMARAAYWKRKHEELDVCVREYGASCLSGADHHQYRQVHGFYLNVPDILSVFADRIRVTDLEAILQEMLGNRG